MRTLSKGSEGTDVMEIQSLLKKIGYEIYYIDGIFGSETERAVKEFQKQTGLTQDGIIGPATYAKLEPLLMGTFEYTIKPGDTLWYIATRFKTTVNKIITANPGINPNSLQIGQVINVPFGFDIVDTDISYTYDVLERDIEGLKLRYPFLEVGTIGKSVLGRDLYYLRLGEGDNKVFYNAAHHALEWVTSPVLMKFTENFLDAYVNNKSIRGYDINEIWKNSSIYLVPMVNPDGIDLVLNGLSKDNPYYDELIKWNGGSKDFSTSWQSNNKGIDLNHNYPAKWQESKDEEEALGISCPGPTRCSGPNALSEPESKAIVDFVKQHDFRLVLAYHSQGQVIYWTFDDLQPMPESKIIGEKFSDASGYELGEIYGIGSYAGMKDWFIQDYLRPGYTIEVGRGKNPLPIEQFPMIYNNNEELLLLASII